MIPKDRRVRIVFIQERLLSDLFKGPGQCVAIRLNDPRLPQDAEVLCVRHDFDRQALAAIVHSTSFGQVAPGSAIPPFDDGCWDYVLRYIDGDRIVERKPLAVKQAEYEA